MMVVKSSRKSSTHRWTTQKKSPMISNNCQKRPRAQVLESLVPEPVPAAPDPAVHAGEAAEHHGREGPEQAVSQPVLSPRLTPRDHGGQKDAGRQVRRGHPENGRLEGHVRARLNGNTVARSPPKKLDRSTR